MKGVLTGSSLSPRLHRVTHLLAYSDVSKLHLSKHRCFSSIGVSGLVPLCERAVDVVRQTAGIVASPSDLTYDIWTDGACAHKTSGAGGYAAVLVARRSDGSIAEQWELSGGDVETTNNRMELMAVIAGLRALPAPARVCIHIDSTYVMKNFKGLA